MPFFLLKNVHKALRTGGFLRFNFAGNGNISSLLYIQNKKGNYMRYVTIILLLFFLSFPVNSNANQDGSDILAEKFLVVTKQKDQNRKLLDLLKTQISQQINNHSKTENLNENKRKLLEKYSHKMTNILVEELSWEKIKENHVKIIKSIYSDEELRSLIQFFESELGQLYINKQQVAMQKLGESSQIFMQNVVRRIQALEQEMKSEFDK